jgi:hypothetical protein
LCLINLLTVGVETKKKGSKKQKKFHSEKLCIKLIDKLTFFSIPIFF